MNQTKSKTSIYLDHAATTPVRPEVVAAMRPYWNETYGNPAAAHQPGRAASQALEKARRAIAAQLGAFPDEITFTASGSESDNLALRGAAWAARATGRGEHLIVSAIEHPAVLQTAVQLRDLFGFSLTVLPVDEHGRVDPDQFAAAIGPDTVLASVMAANNEIGTVQPIAALGAIARERGVLFHTDAVQAAVTRPWDLANEPIDLMSLAAHKFYGPKGIGILYARRGVTLTPALTGGQQEEGRRPGTGNVPLAAGAAKALELAMGERETAVAHAEKLRDRIYGRLLQSFPDLCRRTGHPAQRLPFHASVAFRHLNANDILMHLDQAGVAAGSGSACTTGDPRPSATLAALGLDPTWTKGGLRFTVGRQNTLTQIDYMLDTMDEIVPKLYKLRELM